MSPAKGLDLGGQADRDVGVIGGDLDVLDHGLVHETGKRGAPAFDDGGDDVKGDFLAFADLIPEVETGVIAREVARHEVGGEVIIARTDAMDGLAEGEVEVGGVIPVEVFLAVKVAFGLGFDTGSAVDRVLDGPRGADGDFLAASLSSKEWSRT